MRSPYVWSSAVTAPTTPASASAATSAAREPGARDDARAPEARRARERERDGAAGQPPVRREQRREQAEHEEGRRAADRPAPSRSVRARREAEERGEQRDRVQHQLLRHEEAVELELLVDDGGEHDRDRARLQQDVARALGERGRRWRVGAAWDRC